jgi:flagella basal body P-ring formation protein FlgA
MSKLSIIALLLALLAPAVTWATASSPTAAAVAAARAAVEQRLGTAYGDVHLSVTSQPEHLALSKGALTFHPHPVAGRWPRARFVVVVDVLEGGRVLHTVPVGFALSAYATAWVYRDDLTEHLPADVLPLIQRSVDIAATHVEPLTSLTAIKGRRLRHPVRAGQIASAEDFETVPDVDNRQTVRLLASYGDITVERTGLALRAANRGQMVPVQVAGAAEPVNAVVKDRGVTEVVP